MHLVSQNSRLSGNGLHSDSHRVCFHNNVFLKSSHLSTAGTLPFVDCGMTFNTSMHYALIGWDCLLAARQVTVKYALRLSAPKRILFCCRCRAYMTTVCHGEEAHPRPPTHVLECILLSEEKLKRHFERRPDSRSNERSVRQPTVATSRLDGQILAPQSHETSLFFEVALAPV